MKITNCRSLKVNTIQYLAFGLFIVAITFSSGFTQDRSTQAPEVQSFALNPDLKGIGESSVNLYSGDVNLPVNLVSLSGRGGLDVNVTMSYNSNIQQVEDVWNLDAPTGILGLGWSMDYDKIVVDHKQTGNRHDDEFYLITGGASNRLIQTGYDPYNSAVKTYETENYQFWKIRYIPSDERWEITKEDGTVYQFGGSVSTDASGNKTSTGNTVQWGVKWGNWIGNSGRTQGQQQHAIAWNISKVTDRWDNAISYTYDEVVEEVGRSGNPDYNVGKRHTKASYLSEITNPEGKKIRFVYGEKEAFGSLKEYYDPHTEPVPDEKISVSISGPTYLYENDSGTWSSSVSGGVSPYSYSWAYRYICRSSCSGEGIWHLGGTGSSFSYNWKSWISQLEIRLYSQDADGRSGEDYHFVSFQSPSGGDDPCSNCEPEPTPILQSTTTDSDPMLTTTSSSITTSSFEPSTAAGSSTESSDPNEPDAYQEKYETRYLDYIIVKNEKDEQLFVVDFDYIFNGDGEEKPPKRLLESVKQVIPNGETLPEMNFSYYDALGAIHSSALKTVTYPTGATVEYTYLEKSIGRSDREIYVSVPTYYDDPRIFIAEDYVVTTWRNGSSLKLKMYTWDGEWIEHEYGPISYAGKMVNNKQNFEIFLEKNFFILLDRFYENSSTKRVYIFRKDTKQRGNWHDFAPYLSFDDWILDKSSVATGNDFFAITDIETGKLYRYTWRSGSSWRTDHIGNILSSASDPNFFIGGTNNYFVFDNEYASGPDILTVHYLDENKQWKTKNISTSTTQFESRTNTSTSDRNYIWADNSHFAILAKDTYESIFRLYENYNLSSVYNIGSLIDEDPVFNINNSTITFAQYGGYSPKTYRFDGLSWRNANVFLDNYTFSSGNDLLVKRDGYYGDGKGAYITYDANLSQWSGSTSLTGPSDRTFPEVGYRSFIFGENIYFKNSSGSSLQIGSISQTSGYKVEYRTLRAGINFYSYGVQEQTGSNSFSPYGSYVYPIKNGSMLNTGANYFSEYAFDATTSYQRSNLVGGNTVVTRSINASLDNSTNPWVKLYRIINDKVTGNQKDYPVTSVTVNDGYSTQSIAFDYYTNNATYDPTGALAQYNKITVRKGTNEGYVEHYFYNGLLADDADVINDPDISDPHPYWLEGNEGLLKGLSYATKTFNSGNQLIALTQNHWKVYQQVIKNNGVQIAQSQWLRKTKTESTIDGVTTSVEQLFNTNTGLPTKTITYNYDVDGGLHTHEIEKTYWWQHYDTDRSENLLTPVIKTEEKVNNNTTSIVASTWKDWGNNKWAPHKTYQWKGSGDGNFDYANWSGTGEAGSDWLKGSEIKSRNTYGGILEGTDQDNIVSTRHFVKEGLRVGASFANTNYGNTKFVNMDSYRSTTYGDLADGLYEYNNGNGILSYSKAADNINSSSQRIEIDNLTDRGAGTYMKLSGLTPGEKYILDFQYKLTQGEFDVFIWSGTNGTGSNTNYDEKGGWKTKQIIWTYESGQNVYFRAPWNGSGANDVTFYLDNIRVYPARAYAESYSYDMKKGQPENYSNIQNRIASATSDDFGRIGSSIGSNSRVLQHQGQTYSRELNGGTFSNIKPNQTHTISYIDEAGYDNFTSSGDWSVTSSGDIIFGIDKANELTVQMGTNGSWNGINKNVGGDDVIARVDFYADGGTGGTPHVLYFQGSGQRFAVHYVPSSDRFRIQYQKNSGNYQYSSNLPLLAPPNNWYTVEIVKRTDGICKAWVYRRGEPRDELNSFTVSGFPASWDATIQSSSNDDFFWLANLYAGRYTETISFKDGLGRTIQTQIWESDLDKYFVNSVEYDDLGREWKIWKPYLYNTEGTYDENFASNIQNYYGSSARLYEETQYFSDPLSRVKKVIPVDNGTSGIQYAYGSENIDGQLFNYTELTGLDNIKNRTYRDRQGNTVRTVSDYGNSGALISETKVDPTNRITESRPPHYFTPPTGSIPQDWVTTNWQDFLGRTTQVQTTDAGILQNKFDEEGRLRFTQDANQASAAMVGFTRYDALGRAVASGEAPADFGILNGNQSYGFETDQLTQIQATAWDDKPSSTVFPWSLFATELSGTSLLNTHGKVTASAFKTTGKGEAGQILENQTVSATTTIEIAGALTVGPSYTIESGADVTMYSGTQVTLKPGFHAKAGSRFKASIDPALSSGGDNDHEWQLTLFSYDEEGRMTTKNIFTQDKPALDTEISYNYDHLGQVIKQHVQVGSSQHFYHFYDYDVMGRLAAVYTNTIDDKPGTPEMTYSYNADGSLNSETINGVNNASLTYGYDLKGRLETLANGNGSFSESIGYNSEGTISSTGFTNAGTSYSYTYDYDRLNRLKAADYSGSTSFDVNGLTYDKHGNIKTLRRYKNYGGVIDDLTYTLQDRTNRLQSVTDAMNSTGEDWDAEDGSFTYDANGNQKTNTGRGITNISYETRNLPLSMSLNNGLKTTYRYNSARWRILNRVEDGGATTVEENYILDGATTLAVTDASGSVKHWNLFGNGLIGRLEANGTRKYYLKDHIGSTRQVLNSSGTLLEYYDYYPFGLVMRSGATQLTKETFTGKEQDHATGYYYFGARYYDAALSGWGVTDPAGQFHSPYVYTGNPISYTDPDGEFILPVLAAVAYGAAIGAGVSAVTYSAITLPSGNFSLKGLGQSALAGGIGGAVSGGFSHFATGLGSFGLSLGYNTLSNTAGFTASTLATGGDLTLGTLAGSFTGGLVGGAIPGFQGIDGNWAANASAELAHSARRGLLVGAVSGATSAAIDGQNVVRGLSLGATRGALGHTMSSGLTIAALGPAFIPNEAQNDLGFLEWRMKSGGLEAGSYKPVNRRGGLFSLFTNKGIALGRNLVVPTKSRNIIMHEQIHYYQQIRDGFGLFGAKGFYEQLFLKNPYNKSGTQENQVECLMRFYGFGSYYCK